MKIVILSIACMWLAFGLGTYFATRGLGPEISRAEMIKTILAGPLSLIGWLMSR